VNGAAIELTGVGKRYQIGTGAPGYATLRESITNIVRRPFQRGRPNQRPSATPFWALRDLDLRLGRGEVVGVIGRNGSGKSTLLKLIAGVTWPTTGRIELEGRVTPLLEVGTGFHPELTGRENVYLNGAILGLSRREVDRRFQSIVEFAGIHKFMDTEVRRYSSGMHVRLAFAVAAHTDPEILLIDEVLTVGDAEFQKRCLEKVEEIAAGGTTVLLVTHNMAMVTRFCERAILLRDGRQVAEGKPDDVVSAYLETAFALRAEVVWPEHAWPGGAISKIVSARLLDEDGQLSTTVDIRKPIAVEIEFAVLKEAIVAPGFTLHNQNTLHLWTAADQAHQLRSPGRYRSTVQVPGNLLADGNYSVGVQLRTFDPQRLEAEARDVVLFSVVDSLAGDAARGHWRGHWQGAIRPLLSWATLPVEAGGSSAPVYEVPRRPVEIDHAAGKQ
jgi:lipopolysaccharide transport system ATP-binding protein